MLSPDVIAEILASPKFLARFWSKVRKTDGCWTWTSNRDRDGYGLITIGRAPTFTTIGAHRVSWMLANKQGLQGLCALHRCDNPSCVNPEHLFLGTHQDNMRDKQSKGRAVVLRGERSGNAKLTEALVREIRHRCSMGACKAAMSRELGISRRAIRLVETRQAWKHVE